MGEEQLMDALLGTTSEWHDTCFPRPHSPDHVYYDSFPFPVLEDDMEVKPHWEAPAAIHTRLEPLLLSQDPKRVTAIRMLACGECEWGLGKLLPVGRSCVNLQSLSVGALPDLYFRGHSCLYDEILKEPTYWTWPEGAQVEQMKQLITGCPHLRSLHFHLNTNEYLTIREEVFPLLSRLEHLSLPLADLPPCLLPHLSSLRSLRLSLSAPQHPLLSGRPFHSLPLLSLLHLSLLSPTSLLSEPLSPDLFAGLGPSLRSLTFLVYAKPKGAATPSSGSLRHLTLMGTAGVIPLAVWGRLCPQLLSLKIQGSPHVAVRGSGEQLAEGSGKGDVGLGACGEGEGACGEGEGACGAAEEAAACFFPSLEELVLRNLPAEVLPAEVLPAEVLPAEVLPAEVLPAEVLPAEVLPAEVLPAEVLPAEVLPAEAVPAEVLECVFQRIQLHGDEASVRGLCPSLPSPASLAHTLTLYPNLSALLLPIVSTASHPLRPSHVRSLLSAAAALPALTSLSVLLEPGFRGEYDWGYGRDELWEIPEEEREREFAHSSPFARLSCLRSLSIHVCENDISSCSNVSLDDSRWSGLSEGLLLGLPACLSSLSLHLPTTTMPASFSSLTALTLLATNLWIPGLQGGQDEGDGGVGEEEWEGERWEDEAEEESGIGEGDEDGWCDADSCPNGDEDACFSQEHLPRLPRLRRFHVQSDNYEIVNMTRLMAAVAHSLEQLQIAFVFTTLCSRGSTTGLSFRKLKLLHLEFLTGDSRVDMSLFPALEHMVLTKEVDVYWEVESGFSSNLRFLQLGYAVRLPKDPGDREHELMQLTALTTLIVDNADYRDFLAALSCFSSLRTLRLSNITRGCSEPHFSCPPLLSTLQICFSDLPRLPPSLAHFSCLTHLDLLHWRHLHSLPPFLSSFSSLRHLKVTCDGPKPTHPACLKGFLQGRDWYKYSPCDGRDWHEHLRQ
ncbi:unnamed protein product [Closterium sp. Yama58-4]|nr:unnamed protein product [Closterium sp. Yama58-4]